ncbi:hypothetical protein COOONC_07251 [Cooperia oncophora]
MHSSVTNIQPTTTAYTRTAHMDNLTGLQRTPMISPYDHPLDIKHDPAEKRHEKRNKNGSCVAPEEVPSEKHPMTKQYLYQAGTRQSRSNGEIEEKHCNFW